MEPPIRLKPNIEKKQPQNRKKRSHKNSKLKIENIEKLAHGGLEPKTKNYKLSLHA